MLEKAERCVLCGTAEWEWLENKFAYEPVEHYCHGCYLKAMAQDDDPKRNTKGVTMELLPTGTQEAAQRLIRAKKKWLQGGK